MHPITLTVTCVLWGITYNSETWLHIIWYLRGFIWPSRTTNLPKRKFIREPYFCSTWAANSKWSPGGETPVAQIVLSQIGWFSRKLDESKSKTMNAVKSRTSIFPKKKNNVAWMVTRNELGPVWVIQNNKNKHIWIIWSLSLYPIGSMYGIFTYIYHKINQM